MKMSETSQPSSENDGKCHRPHGSRRRQVHNEVERRRKDKINGWIAKIAELLPRKEQQKQSKISILEQTVDYIKLLVSERNKLLSENCSEVQAEEIRKLKKDLQLLSEQNTLYEKLLEQSNISLTIPKKSFKYSNKFERRNGILTVKNHESNTCTYVDSAIQVGNSMCVNNISASVSSNSTSPPLSENSKLSKTKSKNSKSKAKMAVASSKPVKIVSAPAVKPGSNPLAIMNSLQSNNSMTPQLTTQTVQQSSNVSQENIFPIIDWNDSTKISAPSQAGGVTTVLSQFPVMSTTLGSSFSNVCHKNVPTIIIPTGGNILQSFPTEKLSNTISIICPSTLPILVPQQVLNVPSVARNVGLPPTILCPGPVESNARQVEKTNLGSALLTINPNPIVPISSSLSANTQIILPSQPTLLGNNSGNVSLTHNIISPLLTAVSQSDDLTVPLVQKLPVSSTSSYVQDSSSASDNSCNSESLKVISNEQKSTENALETSKTLPSNVCIESKTSQTSVEDMSKNKIKQDGQTLNSNTPPSLKDLLKNKVLSALSYESQNKTANKEISDKILYKPVTFNKSKPNECVESYTTVANTSSKQTELIQKQKFNEIKEVENLDSAVTSTQNSADLSSVKSNFSLTVLIGKCLSEKNSSENVKSDKNNLSHGSNNVIVSETAETSTKNLECISNSLENERFSKISESEAVFSVAKENAFESSVQLPTDTHNSETNSESKKISEANSINSNTVVLNNLSADVSSSTVESNTHPNFDNTGDSIPIVNTSNAGSNMLSAQRSEVSNVSSKENPVKSDNAAQNNQSHTDTSSRITSSVNALNDSVPYSVNASSVNHSLLPSLFANNQIVSLNSQVLVCHTGNENASNVLLPQSLIANETTNQNLSQCLLHYSQGDFQAFSVLSDSMATLTSVNDSNKRSSEINLNFSENSIVNNSTNSGENRKIDDSTENNNNKEFLAAKRKDKAVYKESKTNVIDKNNSNSQNSNNTSGSKIPIHTVDMINSFPKNDVSNCSRAESGFNYSSNASDILARATETIFCNDILENSQASKRNEDCFTDDVSNLNEAITSTEKIVDNFKIQYNQVQEDHDISDASTEKNKKDISENTEVHSDIRSSSYSIQANVKNTQEINSKQIKFCKVRKTKANNDSEPPYKKLKETAASEKGLCISTYDVAHQNEKINEKNISIIHTNLTFLEKQVSSSSHISPNNENITDSAGNFNNQIHISENSCKTPSSVDTIFSLTPMLGDILKDVSHNVNLDSRNAFATVNENQHTFSSEKNFISFNYQNNSHEDYLNLPRMSFPVMPEISSTPVVHVTTVSYAHSVSLCSTQSDSQKVAEIHSSTESQSKQHSKKKDILPVFHNHSSLNLDIASDANIIKQSDCAMKTNDSETHFNSMPAKVTNSSGQFENQHTVNHIQSGSSVHSTNLVVSQSNNQYNPRDNFISPISHSLSFYPTISTSSNAQNFPCTTSSLPHNNFSNNVANVGKSSASFTTSENMNNSFNSQISLSKTDNLSHSLCSLLKENSNIAENRAGTSETTSQSTSSSSNVTQSKYSALSLISDQTSYSQSVTNTTCHSHFVQSTTVHTTSVSDGQYLTTVSSCNRNPKTSLSYSAESLLQTSCANSEKNKNNKNGRFQMRSTDKKVDRSSVSHMHSLHDTNVFMPVTSCDINIQNAPLVPLPPVTSFHNFSTAYTVCDSSPSTTIFNSVSRNQDNPLSLSSDNFLNHINLNVESQMLSNRHEMPSAVPKPHSNVTLQFENSNSLYNNCNFLPHVKPTMENSRSSEASQCFQPSSYNNNYSQQSQKPNCCQFTHRAVATNTDIVSSDINLTVSGAVPSFHNEKNNFQPNRSGLQTSFSQNNSNFMGNFFYNASANCHDGNERNDINIKPSTIRSSQEIFVPEGVRQSIHDQNTNINFNTRKSTPSNRTKSKKTKNISSNDNVNVIPTCVSNCNSSQDNSCNKVNISYVPTDYFKSSSNSILPTPGPIQCSQNKISETIPSAVIPPNPSFNPVLHQQSDSFLNLNFQHSNFTMSPLPRPPTQPLSCSCLTTPIISHTFSSSTPHPVPNFNLSNILPDMGCSGNQVSFSPPKFPMNHPLSSSSTQCHTSATLTNPAHIVSHQSCAPSLYPPHPPMVRGSLNPILSHNSQSLIDSQVSLVASAGSGMSQNSTFTATQNPPFRNVIHPITFPRSDR